MDGLYLYMSQEHYCTHVCHVKATKSKRLSKILQLSHKSIMNPTTAYVDKVMHTISMCAAVPRGMAGGKTPQEIQDLQHIVELAGRTVSKNALAMEQGTAQHTVPPLRVQHTTHRITLSVMAMQAPAPMAELTTERPATETKARSKGAHTNDNDERHHDNAVVSVTTHADADTNRRSSEINSRRNSGHNSSHGDGSSTGDNSICTDVRGGSNTCSHHKKSTNVRASPTNICEHATCQHITSGISDGGTRTTQQKEL